MYILMKYQSDFKKYWKYEDEMYFNILFVCLFICLICPKHDLNYKLNTLGPLCLWQCFGMFLVTKYSHFWPLCLLVRVRGDVLVAISAFSGNSQRLAAILTHCRRQTDTCLTLRPILPSFLFLLKTAPIL